MFLTKEQVSEMTIPSAKKALALITKKYNLEKPLNECFKEVWPVLDELTNTILYLEDHIQHSEVVARLNDARPTKEKRALAELENKK
jgi:hypothetical protein